MKVILRTFTSTGFRHVAEQKPKTWRNFAPSSSRSIKQIVTKKQYKNAFYNFWFLPETSILFLQNRFFKRFCAVRSFYETHFKGALFLLLCTERGFEMLNESRARDSPLFMKAHLAEISLLISFASYHCNTGASRAPGDLIFIGCFARHCDRYIVFWQSSVGYPAGQPAASGKQLTPDMRSVKHWQPFRFKR
ncbi:hypothetical protein DSECCO2_594140 [anaerobic digester metagenome]